MEGGIGDGQGGVRPDDLDGLVLLDALWSSVEQEGEQSQGLVGAGLWPAKRLDRRPSEVNPERTDGVDAHGPRAWTGGKVILDEDDRRFGGVHLGGIHGAPRR